MIKSYTWPGNVRELRHQVSRAMLLSVDSQITDIDLALPMHRAMAQSNIEDNANPSAQITLDEAEKAILLQVLVETRNNVSQAARKLGITRMTMRYRMDKHNLT
jgi:DNA-binding NtrC family response regulator